MFYPLLRLRLGKIQPCAVILPRGRGVCARRLTDNYGPLLAGLSGHGGELHSRQSSAQKSEINS